LIVSRGGKRETRLTFLLLGLLSLDFLLLFFFLLVLLLLDPSHLRVLVGRVDVGVIGGLKRRSDGIEIRSSLESTRRRKEETEKRRTLAFPQLCWLAFCQRHRLKEWLNSRYSATEVNRRDQVLGESVSSRGTGREEGEKG